MQQTDTCPTAPRQRMEWLDAMRGFTMILVVAYHVAQMGFDQPVKQSNSMSFLLLFRMPLFFFVSGFLAYKANITWSVDNLLSLLAKKLRVQLLPTIVFLLFSCVALYPKFMPALQSCLASPTKGGYWFTLVLLYMFVLYYLFCYIEDKLIRFKCPTWLPISILFVLSLLVYETCYLPKLYWWADGHKGKDPTAILDYTSLIQLMKYMPFFLFGNIVRRYWHQAQRIMDSQWFFPSLVVIVIFCTMDILKWHTLRMAWANIPSTISKFSLLTMVFMYFRHYAPYFTQSTLIGSCLQYIGRRTLDIYLIHFLFLPNLPAVGTFFKTNKYNFVIDTSLSILIGLLVIGFCIITSNLLRINPILRKYLFGRG